MLLSKRDKLFHAAERLGALCCPVCGGTLKRDGDNLTCERGHVQNVNRKGCLNMLTKQAEGCYDAELFAARQRVLASGCYEPAAQAIERALPDRVHRLLDAGCGEGWYLNRMLTAHPDWCGIGADISRDAILRATDQPCEAVWCVADLRRLPLADGSITAVLDVLTPAAYSEFARVLEPGGVLVKVYPGHLYLREIREARGLPLYEEGDVDTYLRAKTCLLSREQVTVTHPVSDSLWADFVRMTPLNQDLTAAEKDALAARNPGTVTVDLVVAAAEPVVIGGMTREELDAELAKGMASIRNGDVLSADDVDKLYMTY